MARGSLRGTRPTASTPARGRVGLEGSRGAVARGAFAVLALAALGACRPTRPCRDHTVFATVVLGKLSADTAELVISVSLNARPKKEVQASADGGRSLGRIESVEITFDDDVTPKLEGAMVEVTVSARSARGDEVGNATASGLVTDRCLALTVDFTKQQDGGSDGGSDALACAGSCSVGSSQCVEEGIQSCVQPTSGCPTTQLTACTSAAPVCERSHGPVCADPQWAAWPMPNGTATPSLPNQASYNDNGDGTIGDNVTKLIWQKAPTATPLTWSQAKDYCQTLTLGPFTDWRLPTEIELLSLVDHARKPAIDATFFPDTSLDNYWSATDKVGTPGEAWFVRFRDGRTNCSADQLDVPETVGDGDCTAAQYQKDNAYRVRCVR